MLYAEDKKDTVRINGPAGDRTRFFGFEARKDIHYPTSPLLIHLFSLFLRLSVENPRIYLTTALFYHHVTSRAHKRVEKRQNLAYFYWCLKEARIEEISRLKIIIYLC